MNKFQWDPEVKYDNHPCILQGGYKTFMLTYPMLTTNAKYVPQIASQSETVNVGDIEYPSWDDIKMKDNQRLLPTIDRTNKRNALSKYALNKKPIGDIAKENEAILDQKLKKESEALNIGNELKNLLDAGKATIDFDIKKRILVKQGELQYKLYEKESELNDTVSWLRTLRVFFINY